MCEFELEETCNCISCDAPGGGDVLIFGRLEKRKQTDERTKFSERMQSDALCMRRTIHSVTRPMPSEMSTLQYGWRGMLITTSARRAAQHAERDSKVKLHKSRQNPPDRVSVLAAVMHDSSDRGASEQTELSSGRVDARERRVQLRPESPLAGLD